MTDQPQCPFCQAVFDSVELLTLHLVFDSCSLKHEEPTYGEPAPPPAGRRPSQPELVPES